jgi:flagellar assembly protein FliH
VSDQSNVAVQAYEYPVSATDARASWWRPAEIPQEDADDMSSPSVILEERVEERQLKAPELTQADLELRFEAGRQAGFDEGRLTERQAAQKIDHTRLKEQLASLVLKFDQETSRYLQAVEREVVELALAIAARVLRREAQADPLVLTGAVRVALGQLARTTKAQLKVPASDVSLWAETIAHIPNLGVRPTVVADEGISAGDCLLETELGFVDLGIESQLGEIERNLFDAAGQTASSGPAPKGAAPTKGAKVAL